MALLFEIFLDASLIGEGATLAEASREGGNLRALAVMSKSLSPTQRAWPAWV